MTAPTPERRVGEADGLTREWIQEMAACKDTTSGDRVMMVDPSRGLFLNQRNALARRVLALTAEVEQLRVVGEWFLYCVEGEGILAIPGKRDRDAFRAALSLPTPAPEATETECPDCEGEGFTVETFPDCCGYPDGEGLCCGSAVPREHQVGCERCQATGKVSAPPAPEGTDGK